MHKRKTQSLKYKVDGTIFPNYSFLVCVVGQIRKTYKLLIILQKGLEEAKNYQRPHFVIVNKNNPNLKKIK